MSAAKARRESAIVVGGGVVGASVALRLQERGIATTLVDPGSMRAASLGNAGHIAVEQVEPLAGPGTLRRLPGMLYARGGPVSLPLRDIAAWLPFGLRFLAASRPARFRAGTAALRALVGQAVPAWRRQLEIAGASDLLIERGHFLVWESEAAAAEGRARWRGADTGAVTVRDAAREELQAIEENLSHPLAGGLRFEGSAQIADLDALALALAAAFASAGGRRVPAEAKAVDPGSVTLASGEKLRADAVVIAAGGGSGRLLAPLGHKVPLIAERGYHLQSSSTDWPADLPPVVFEQRSMIVTRFRSGLRAAGFFEFGRAESPPDPSKWRRLEANLAGLGIGFSEPVEWMGARPTLPDYLPAIGESGKAPGLLYAFGHQHLGLTLAAATGEAVAALVAGEAAALDLSPFAIERFGRR